MVPVPGELLPHRHGPFAVPRVFTHLAPNDSGVAGFKVDLLDQPGGDASRNSCDLL